MRIVVQTKLGGPKDRYRMLEHEVAETPDYCCDGMQLAWGDTVNICLNGFPRFENLSACLAVSNILGSEELIVDVKAIGYCPWCGSRIVLTDVTRNLPPNQQLGLRSTE